MLVYVSYNAIGMIVTVICRVSSTLMTSSTVAVIKLAMTFNKTQLPKQSVIDWAMIGYFVVSGTLPLANFFLALERCLAIQLVNKFTTRQKNVLFVINLFGSPGKKLV
ncbi:hypothetical protein Ddc_24342 [Ditylenchus destructor]|nr:hypothetical protein Ddc_24342 [Ditylenchus destructor]